MTTIDDLLKDWQERSIKNPLDAPAYVIRLKELIEYIADPNMSIRPYRRENGKMDYSLRVIGDGKQQGK